MLASSSAPSDFAAFRTDLVSSLKGSGTLDSLKTQVRSHLLTEIRRQGRLAPAAPSSSSASL